MIHEPAGSALLDQLERFSPMLAEEARRAAMAVAERFSREQVERWALLGVHMASGSYRSWEAARAYFAATPSTLAFRGFDDMMRWASLGEQLCASSPAIACSYFSAGEELSSVPLVLVERLAGLVLGLHKRNLGSEALLSEVVRDGSRLVEIMSHDLPALGDFVSAICRFSAPDSKSCLHRTVDVLPLLRPEQRPLLLSIVGSVAPHGWGTVRAFLEAASQRLRSTDATRAETLLGLIRQVSASCPGDALSLLAECWDPLRALNDHQLDEVVKLASELARISPQSVVAFLTSAPTLLKSIDLDDLGRWVAQGLCLLEDNQLAGLAFLRVESRSSAQLVEQLSCGVRLPAVQHVLAIYCQALTGRPVRVRPTAELVDQEIGWTHAEQATTEGRDIYLPPFVSQFSTRAENFSYYKVLASHQAGHLEFGTFTFAMERSSTRYVDLRPALAARAGREGSPSTAFEAFFDLFPRRRLAKDLFCVVEDARVDGCLMRQYAGLSEGYARVRQSALAARGPQSWSAGRRSCVEAALRLSLGEPLATLLSTSLGDFAQRSWALLAAFLGGQGTVEDSAEATIRLYALVEDVVRRRAGATLEHLPTPYLLDADAVALGQDIATLAAPGRDGLSSAISGEEDYDDGPDLVDYRGELKPELIQALMKLRGEERRGDGFDGGLDPEILRALLEKGLEVEIGDLVLGDLTRSSPLLVTNLVKEAQRDGADRLLRSTGTDRQIPLSSSAPAFSRGAPGIGVREYRYDEWDFRAEDYRLDWCTLKERELPSGSPDYFEAILREHADLADEIRRQFEQLRPELYERRRNLDSGDELDLNAAVESLVDRRARLTPSEKLYWRREKQKRDVSVAVLLDMSASTGDELKDPAAESFWRDQVFTSWEDEYAAWQQWCTRERRKRIIDLEKESVVLLVEALEIVRDTYGIYGFSGYGRDNVELYVVKELAERCDAPVKARIASIDAQRGTRMGPAIRHVATKLAKQESRVKLLLLLSDGYPQDHEYGRDRTERDYALHDTRMALLEARRQDIVPFCVTVDQSGQDYLKLMCPDMGYVVVSDLESLPRRLPSLYRALTAR